VMWRAVTTLRGLESLYLRESRTEMRMAVMTECCSEIVTRLHW
jgi:hypothetical protein